MTFLYTPLTRISPWRPVLGAPRPARGSDTGPWRPAVNLWTDDLAVHLEAELPGVTEDSLELTVLGDELTLAGSRDDAPVEGGRVLRRERTRGAFRRVVSLPFTVDAQQVEATLQHGVLTVRLPKAAAHRPRQIKVTSAR
jgi:HSP20 family protein